MDLAKWQHRLEDTFSVDGIIGANLQGIINQEKACGKEYIYKFKGQDIIMHAFQSFF